MDNIYFFSKNRPQEKEHQTCKLSSIVTDLKGDYNQGSTNIWLMSPDNQPLAVFSTVK